MKAFALPLSVPTPRTNSVMLVGLGGNNGTTLTGGVIANREGITWKTKEGVRAPNYWGSLTQASTCRVGAMNGQEVHAPFKALLPMVEPNDIVFDGWDINNMNMADAMERAQVLDWDLQRQLIPHMVRESAGGFRVCGLGFTRGEREGHQQPSDAPSIIFSRIFFFWKRSSR